MSETLSYFLADLASNAEWMQAFLANPSWVLGRSKLNDVEKAAILARDGDAIRQAMGLSPGKSAMDLEIKDKPPKPGKPQPGKKPAAKKKSPQKKK